MPRSIATVKDHRGYPQDDAFRVCGDLLEVGSLFGACAAKFYEAMRRSRRILSALAYVERLYEVERETKLLAPERPSQLRRRRLLLLLDESDVFLVEFRADVLFKVRWGKQSVVWYRVGTGLRYCEHPAIVFDNNLSDSTPAALCYRPDKSQRTLIGRTGNISKALIESMGCAHVARFPP